MRYIHLTESELQSFENLYRTGAKSHIRQRAQCILLSHRGYSVPSLAKMFSTRTHTVRAWFNRWDTEGIQGLEIRPGRGLKPAIRLDDAALVESIKEEAAAHPRNIKEAVLRINARWGLDLSEGQLKTFLKKS